MSEAQLNRWYEYLMSLENKAHAEEDETVFPEPDEAIIEATEPINWDGHDE